MCCIKLTPRQVHRGLWSTILTQRNLFIYLNSRKIIRLNLLPANLWSKTWSLAWPFLLFALVLYLSPKFGLLYFVIYCEEMEGWAMAVLLATFFFFFGSGGIYAWLVGCLWLSLLFHVLFPAPRPSGSWIPVSENRSTKSLWMISYNASSFFTRLEDNISLCFAVKPSQTELPTVQGFGQGD